MEGRGCGRAQQPFLVENVSRMAKLIIHVDGSKEVGFGHLGRMQSLVEIIGCAATVVTMTPGSAGFFFDASRIQIVPTLSRMEIDTELKRLSRPGDVVILDPPYYPHTPGSGAGEAWQDLSRTLRDTGVFVVRITDEETASVHDCDLLVNDHPAAVRQVGRYREAGDIGSAMVGPEYFIVDPCHHAARPQSNGLLVCLGGTDQNDLSLRFRDAFRDVARHHEVTVISNSPDLGAVTLPDNLVVKSIMPRPDFSSLLKGATLVFTASGNLLFERIFHHRPGLSVSQFARQELIGLAFQERGLTRHLGPGQGVPTAMLTEVILGLMASKDERNRQIDVCKKLCIASGSGRIVSAIMALMADHGRHGGGKRHAI
jgi:spore coat polysaccharide biosynthesis predicted glycosyltransferase SpsG